MADLTLLDLAARSGGDVLTGLIEEVTTFAPEFNTIPAFPRAGTSYPIVLRTGLPTGGFRNANEGSATVKSTVKRVIKEMYFFDCQLQTDEMIVKGDDRSLGDVLSDEAAGALQAAINTFGSQVYYGVDADAKGFAGLRSQLVSSVSAGGTTNTTSAYLVWMGRQGVSFQVGNDGAISLPAYTKQQIVDPNDSTKRLMAYVSNLSSYIGLSIGSEQACWSIKGISTTTGQDFTDARGAELLAAVPMARRAGLRWFCNRTAAFTLQKSRASTGQTEAGSRGSNFPPLPTECQGIPITVTDSITNTENNT
jgi:hypothetical protein